SVAALRSENDRGVWTQGGETYLQRTPERLDLARRPVLAAWERYAVVENHQGHRRERWRCCHGSLAGANLFVRDRLAVGDGTPLLDLFRGQDRLKPVIPARRDGVNEHDAGRLRRMMPGKELDD